MCIVEQTNLYTSQVMDALHYDKWSQVTADEICAYFGFMILMSVNHLPALADYWKFDPTYMYRPIADKITRDRYFGDLSLSPFHQQLHPFTPEQTQAMISSERSDQ